MSMDEQSEQSSHEPSPSDGVGDRDGAIDAARAAVAARLLSNQTPLLAFIRRRLGRAAASERDADDVFATTLRRSDALVAANALLAELPDSALLALASAISRRAILESGRKATRTRRIRASASEILHAKGDGVVCDGIAGGGFSGIRREAAHELETILSASLSENDLAIIALRLNDLDWSAIAATLGTTPAGAHRRYYRALQTLAKVAGKFDSGRRS